MAAMAEPDRLAAASVRVIREAQAESGAYLASPAFPTYRYCWFRDSAFVAHAMALAGEADSAGRFHEWAVRVVAAGAAGAERTIERHRRGEQPLPEDVLRARYLPDGTPARDDWPNFQLDGLGAWLWALAAWRHAGHPVPAGAGTAVRLAARYLAELWPSPCFDCWEEQGDQVHVSTLAAIHGGLDAAADLLGEPEWARAAEAVRGFALERGVVRGRLRKHLGSDAVDASLVWAATPFRLVDPAGVVAEATVAEIERTLRGPHGLLRRYLGDTYYGGGEWPLLSAHLGWHLAALGETAGAGRQVELVAATAGDDRLLPEQLLEGVQAPAHVAEWTRRWGPVAKPLTWSHGAYLALHAMTRGA
jgi:GH15 family glucan-1,4-alpha-glucosidase